MYPRDYRDMIAGGVLILFGGGIALQAATAYDVGTPTDFGPGLFPAALGVIAAVLGVLVAVPAMMRRGAKIDMRVRSPLFVIGSIAAFALLIRPFGMIPAIIAVTTLSSFAEEKVRPVGMVGVGVTLCVLAYLIFKLGLGLTLPLLNWPF